MTFLSLLLLLAQDPPTFRADLTLVHVDAEVRQDGKAVDKLTKEDFRIVDGGKAQPILHVGHQEEALDLILLFDTSASMRPVVERVSQTARTALRELREGDRVAVMAFDTDTDLVADFTGDFAAVERSIRGQVVPRAYPPRSQIQRAVDAAAVHFLQRRSPARDNARRRAVLIITDNLGARREKRALRDLWEADAVLAGVIVRDPGMTVQYGIYFPPSLLGYGGMSDIAEKTGGDTISADDAGEGLREMIRRLRLRYSLQYAMPQGKAGEQRKIKVELAGEAVRLHPEATVRARSGYRIPDIGVK